MLNALKLVLKSLCDTTNTGRHSSLHSLCHSIATIGPLEYSTVIGQSHHSVVKCVFIYPEAELTNQFPNYTLDVLVSHLLYHASDFKSIFHVTFTVQ